jgi:hypothetical protein
MAANVSSRGGKRHEALAYLLPGGRCELWLAAGFAPHGDLHFRRADASTSTALPSNAPASETFKADHTANPMTDRIFALDQAKQLTFWTSVLKNKKQVCGGVVRTVYQGGTEFGIESWGISCRDGNQYSVSLGPDWRGFEAEFPASVCNGNAFNRSAD